MALQEVEALRMLEKELKERIQTMQKEIEDQTAMVIMSTMLGWYIFKSVIFLIFTTNLNWMTPCATLRSRDSTHYYTECDLEVALSRP